MVLRCDRLLAGANAALITSKHDDFKKEPEKELQRSLSKNLAMKLTKNLQIDCKNFHLIKYNMAEKSDAPAEAPDEAPEQVLPKVLKTNFEKSLGELRLQKS